MSGKALIRFWNSGSTFSSFLLWHLCVCECASVGHSTCMSSGDSLQELALYFHHVGPEMRLRRQPCWQAYLPDGVMSPAPLWRFSMCCLTSTSSTEDEQVDSVSWFVGRHVNSGCFNLILPSRLPCPLVYLVLDSLKKFFSPNLGFSVQFPDCLLCSPLWI